MRKLSTKILKIITDLLCGEIKKSFYQYRSVRELEEFFRNAKVQVPPYTGGCRVDWVLRSLKELNTHGLQKVLERLINPLEWESDHRLDEVVKFLNPYLIQEGFIFSWRSGHGEYKYILRPLTIREKKLDPNILLKKERWDMNFLFNLLSLHPRVKEASKKLFKDGHYSQAIFEASKVIENLVKEKSGQNNLSGRNLMEKAFNKDNPILKLNELNTRSELDEQEGFKFLFIGAMVGIRNPKAHDNVRLEDPCRALEYLDFASFLANTVDTAKAKVEELIKK